MAREVKDKATGQMKALPSVHFDVGAFCKKLAWTSTLSAGSSSAHTSLSAYRPCQQAVARHRMDVRGQRAIRTSCARCPHSHLTSDHPEAVSAKHALPPKLDSMVTYFRQG